MMQIDYVKISCKKDVHIYCTNFTKEMERNSPEKFSRQKIRDGKPLQEHSKLEKPQSLLNIAVTFVVASGLLASVMSTLAKVVLADSPSPFQIIMVT
jgi:hypothetical protein